MESPFQNYDLLCQIKAEAGFYIIDVNQESEIIILASQTLATVSRF